MTRIYIAVGHGVRRDKVYDPGAAGGGWTEQSSGDIIVAEAARYLRALGADVRSEAYTDDPNFSGTIQAANAWPADLAVEVHHDWAGAPEGAFAHWWRSDSKPLADAIQAAVGAAGFPLRPSWHKKRGDLSFLKSTHMPSVLYEVGRIGAPTLDTHAELQAMGRAIAQGIAKHVGLRPKPLIPEDDDMTATERDQLARVRVATLANSFNVDLANLRLGALLAHFGMPDPPDVEALLVRRDVDLANERRKLGL